MVCKITCTNRSGRSKHGFTLVEVMVSSAIGLIVATALASLTYFTSRSFVAATNYTDLGLYSRMGLDKMSRTIRQQVQVTSFATNSITLQDQSGLRTSYIYNPTARTLVSVSAGQTNTILTQCDTLQFWIYQRTPKSNSFDCYDPAYVTNAKLVQVTWNCSRTILSAKVNTEAMESAKICLRNH